MAGYRDTLNLPRTEFPMKADLPHREPERLAWWNERRAYERLRERRAGRPVRLLHDGPPYSNGHVHMGTAATYVWKDATVRAWSLFGFDSPFVPGWDNHGMPIENQVSQELRARKLEADRLMTRGMCREYAAEWVGVQKRELQRLGVWGDWDHAYLTMQKGFEAEILESFAALAARGFIQRGQRSIHWCPTDRTALAEAEIEYQDDPSPSIFVTFPLKRDPRGVLAGHFGVEALAWTTTPWTLPANLGLMVDPSASYAVVRSGSALRLVAAARVTPLAEAGVLSAPSVEGTLRGAELIDLVFEAPWGNDSRVVDGTPYVSLDEGTGLVHTAPGHGKEDFAVGQKSGLGVVCPVDEAGRFMAGAEPFVGRSVLEVDDDLITWLRERGRLVAASRFTHSYPHCWRCRRPVIFRATDQWFMIIDHDGHRARALHEIENAVHWDPPGSRNRIRDAVGGRPDWCLSRQRVWGVGIPAVYCESCAQASLDPHVMARAAAVTREAGSDAWFERPVSEFLPPRFACPSCGAEGPFRKETDILDVWFDSGCTHRAARAGHPALDAAWTRAREGSGKVAYFEGPDQHRGWFNSSLMVGVGIDHHAPYTDVYTHGWVLDQQGRAMHKSLGNVIHPEDLVKRYGAEIVRWWALATDWRSDVRVGEEILQRVSEAYRKVRNTFRFLLGNLHDFRPADAAAPDRLTRVDRAFLDALRAAVHRMRESYEALEFHRALDQLLNFCTVDLSAVYLDAAKDRLYTLAPDDPERRSAQTALWHALRELAIAVAPALVFTSEEAWQQHPALVEECESVHLAIWEDRPAPPSGEGGWAMLLGLRDAVNATLEPLRADKTLASTTEAAVRIHVADETLAALKPFESELPGFLLVAQAALVRGAEADGARFRIEAARADPARFRKCERCWTYRADVRDSGLCARCTGVLAATGRSA